MSSLTTVVSLRLCLVQQRLDRERLAISRKARESAHVHQCTQGALRACEEDTCIGENQARNLRLRRLIKAMRELNEKEPFVENFDNLVKTLTKISELSIAMDGIELRNAQTLDVEAFLYELNELYSATEGINGSTIEVSQLQMDHVMTMKRIAELTESYRRLSLRKTLALVLADE